jgi:hypothetical protein
MAIRYTLSQGGDPKSTLVVDVCAKVDDHAINAAKKCMYEYGCASGLIFDDSECVLLRDTFTDMSPESISEEKRLSTPLLMAQLGAQNVGSLDIRVFQWLQLLSASWLAAIPRDSKDAQELMYDVVPAATGAKIHPWSEAA